MSYCNKHQLIIPDPTINLQRVVDNGYRLQGSLPTVGQTIGFNGNVVWGNLSIPTLQQVLEEGHTGTDVPIVLNAILDNIETTIEHDQIKINDTIHENTLTAATQILIDSSSNTNTLTAINQLFINSSNATNESTATKNVITYGSSLKNESFANLQVITNGSFTNTLTAGDQTISNGPSSNFLNTIRQIITNSNGDTNTSEATQNKLIQGNNQHISNATTLLILDGLNNTNTINALSSTIYTPSGSNSYTATTQTFTISGFSNTITAANQIITGGGNTNTATSSSVTILNGANSSEMHANGIRINNQYICPEYIHYVNNNTVIDNYSTQLPCKITYINNGLTTPFILSPNSFLIPSSSVTALYDFNSVFVIGTSVGICYRWDGSSFSQFAVFDGPITSFSTTNSGYLLIGGQFTQLQGYGFNCNYIAICDANFTFYQLTDGFNDRVNCLKQCASYTNLVFVGGNFTSTYTGASMPYFSILDFNSGTTSPSFKVLGNFGGGGATGGFNGIVNTISNTSDYVFVGGNFTNATNGVTQYNYPNGTIWQTDYQGYSVNVSSPFYEINGVTGISGPVVCSDYNPTTTSFCIGISGSSTSFNFLTDGTTYTSGLSAQNPITTIYAYLSNLYFADSVNAYINGNLIGNSSTVGVQGISWVEHQQAIGFGISTSGTTGFNFLTQSNKIDCTLPVGAFYFLGQLNTSTKISLNTIGSWFYLLWDGVKYQLLNGQYYDSSPS